MNKETYDRSNTMDTASNTPEATTTTRSDRFIIGDGVPRTAEEAYQYLCSQWSVRRLMKNLADL